MPTISTYIRAVNNDETLLKLRSTEPFNFNYVVFSVRVGSPAGTGDIGTSAGDILVTEPTFQNIIERPQGSRVLVGFDWSEPFMSNVKLFPSV